MENREKIVYVFIDASNLWAAQKIKGRLFDFEKLKKYLKERFQTTELQIYYYTAYPANNTRDYSTDNKHKFYTYLKKNLGIIVRKKPLKRITITTPEGQAVEEKGNMDVEMTIDAVNNCRKFDTAILFSGDSDFLALVNFLKNRDKKVYIFSSKNNISKELISGGHGYTDILNISDDIWGKDLRYRAQK